jgi:protease I
LVLPGGRAPEYLRNQSKARDVVSHFVESGKPIGANCHGPLLLLASCPMKGRTMTAYPDLGIDVRSAGGIYEDSAVVVDENLVTVRGWPDNGPWMREFVKLMKMRLNTPGRQ